MSESSGEVDAERYPDLTPILGSSLVRAAEEARARHSAEAREQQRRFTWELTVANLCLMGAGVLSGLVLVAASRSIPGPTGDTVWTVSNLQLALGGSTLFLGALAAMLTYKAREADRLRRWLNARSQAELARRAVFTAVAEAAAKTSDRVAMQGLAYVRDRLLDDQRRWLIDRARRHRRSSDFTTGWGGLASALAFVGGSGAVIASFAPGLSWLAVAGVVGAAVGAYAVNREALRRDRPNADRYDKAAASLDDLAARYDEIAAEIAAGNPEALVAYTTAVTDQLASEHQQWLDGTAQAETLLAKLDTQLEQIRGGAQP